MKNYFYCLFQLLKKKITEHLNKIYFLFLVINVFVFYQIFNSFLYVELSSQLNFLLKIFQNIIFLFLLLNIFKIFNIKNILFLIPIAYFEQKINFFSFYIHNILLSNNIYGFISKAPDLISPEYPRIIFILIVFFASIINSIKKKNIDKTFFLVGSLGALITTVLFHSVVLFQISKFKENDKNIMENITIASQSKNDFAISCFSNGYTCYYFENKNDLFSSNEVPIELNSIISFIKNDFTKQNLFLFYSTIHKKDSTNRVLGQIPFAIIRKNKSAIVVLNESNYQKILIQNQFVFAILSFISNFVWIFGAIFLMYFHKNKFKKRKV